MISLRTHAISLAAVFLALAIGVALGSGLLSNTVLSGLRDDKKELQNQIKQIEQSIKNETARIASRKHSEYEAAMKHYDEANAIVLAATSRIILTAVDLVLGGAAFGLPALRRSDPPPLGAGQ